MQLHINQLKSHLEKPLQRVYLVSGDEPMQQLEAADAIRVAAKQQGIDERQVIFADAKFEWESLLEQGGTMSLFAEQRMLDIRIEKFPVRGDQQLFLEFIEKVDETLVVLLTAPRLDGKVQKQKWAKTISNTHVWLPVWPIAVEQLPQWLIKKSSERKRQLSLPAAEYLAHQVEGNLLAAKQELDKACLLVHPGEIIEQHLLEQQVTDNARFTPWELLDATFIGDKEKLPRILQRLRQEKIEPMLLAKSLQRDCLALEKMSALIESGKSQASVFQDFRIWGPKQKVMGSALRRYRSNAWQRLWVRALTLEKIIVAQKAGDFWDECLECCLLIAGLQLWPAPKKTKKSATQPASTGAEMARQVLRKNRLDSENARR